MDRLLQFVLFVTFVASSYSHSILRKQSSMPDSPPEFQFSEKELLDRYPAAYIDKLIKALSKEEKDKLNSDVIEVGPRDGNTSSSDCSWHGSIINPILAEDENGTKHYVAKDLTPSFYVELCDYKSGGYKCKNAGRKHSSTRVRCCVTTKRGHNMNVLSEPAAKYILRNEEENLKLKRNNLERTEEENKTSKDSIVTKMMYIDSICECITDPGLDNTDLQNDLGECRRSS